MLVITRKADECLLIGENIKITVVEVKGSSVRLGIEAPKSITIYREEVARRIRQENQPPSGGEAPAPSEGEAAK